MTRQKSSPSKKVKPSHIQKINHSVTPNRAEAVDIQDEIDFIEEIILTSFRIPLTKFAIVEEENLIQQLDLVRIHLPDAFNKAKTIVEQKKAILDDAQNRAEQIISAAQMEAARLLDETGIIQQAQREAHHIHQQVQQECEAIQQKTMQDIESMRNNAIQELAQMRQMAIAEATEIQTGADQYSDAVLNNIEKQLTDMLQVVNNGRQQLSNYRSRQNPK